MEDLHIEKLTDRVRKLIARCHELEALNQELLTSQHHLTLEHEAQVRLNQQIAHTLKQLVRQLSPTEEPR